MLSDTETTASLWMAATPLQVVPPLTQDLRANVCVIGAGIAGITMAYLLALEGRKVVVLEDGAVGGGKTGRTTAHLSNALDDRYHALERLHGPQGAQIAAASHSAAIAAEYVRENVNAVKQYLDYISPGEVRSVADIRSGEGAVLRQGITKLAIYRDETGTIHSLSAVCPHLGCIVHWNSLERTWDCPCHGSRFVIDGTVLNGPAAVGLPRHDLTVASGG